MPSRLSANMYPMKDSNMEGFLEDFALLTFGRSRNIAMASSSCVCCGGPAVEFRDDVSRKEFAISGFCQKCQDKVFAEPEE